MSIFRTAQEHADNPPSTWVVRRVPGSSRKPWLVATADGQPLSNHTTRYYAEEDRTSGPLVRLYAKEARWYAGEPVDGWKPYTGEPLDAAEEADLWEELAELIAHGDGMRPTGPVVSTHAGHRWRESQRRLPWGGGDTECRVCDCGVTWWPWETGWPNVYKLYCQAAAAPPPGRSAPQ